MGVSIDKAFSLKALEYTNLIMARFARFVFDMEENSVGKAETSCPVHFLLSFLCFKKAHFFGGRYKMASLCKGLKKKNRPKLQVCGSNLIRLFLLIS